MELKPEFYHGYPVEAITKTTLKLKGDIVISSDVPFEPRTVPEGMQVVKTIYSEESIQMVLAIVKKIQVAGGKEEIRLEDEWRIVLRPGQYRITDTRRKETTYSSVSNFPPIPVEREAEGPDEEWYESKKIKESEAKATPKSKRSKK